MMDNSLKYFLVVAEELNISKAAKKLYISPQCLSKHIKRLEEKYQVLLFQRKPNFILTNEGIALVKALRKIQIIENSLKSKFKDIKDGYEGMIKIGIHNTRARGLMPKIYPRFYNKYPKVKMYVYNGIVADSEQLVIKGDLDFFVGPYPKPSKELKTILLKEEKIYFVVPDNMLSEYFPDIYPQCKLNFKNGINLTDFKNIPLVMNNNTSNMVPSINNFMKSNNIEPNKVFQTNSNDINLEISALGYGVCFCPEMMLDILYETSILNNKGMHLNVFPILDFNYTNHIVIAYHKDAYLPKYALDCIDIIKDIFYNYKPKII